MRRACCAGIEDALELDRLGLDNDRLPCFVLSIEAEELGITGRRTAHACVTLRAAGTLPD
ncbi:hypothetical protein EON67_11695 [archaeon]|nr:MAG: hypothetical protein EON67_11695 [archaeon]